MSGIVIDVDAKAGSANKELERLNRNLANIVNGSSSSKKALNGLSATNLTNLNGSIRKTTDAFRNLSMSGTKSLNNVNTTAKATVGTFEKLQSVAIKAGAAFAAFSSTKYLLNTADALTNVQNRLNLVNGEAQDLVARQRELFVLSQKTRTSYAATANTFVDFARGLEGTGVSANDAITALDTLQKAAVLSGSSVDSINAALTQLGQGLAAGALRGEELNSVLEQMKYIGPGLAKQLGMTLGQLREFASQGKLTPQLLAKALVGMNRQVSQDFAKTTATTSQAFAQLRESLSYFFGDISKSIGLSNLFANTMIKMSESLLFASDNVVTGFNLIKRSISNFLQRYDNKSAFAITVEGALNLDFNPAKTISKYKQNAVIKRTIEDLKETFNVQNLFVEDTGDRDTFIQKFFGLFVDVGKALAPVRRALTDLTYLRDSVIQVGKLFIGVVDLAAVSTKRVLRAIPLLEFPFKTYITSIKDFLYTSAIDIDTGLRAVYKPITRNFEALTEVLSLYTLGDNRLERGWVDLFKSDSLVEFTDNLYDLSSVMKSVRRNDVNAVFKDATSGFGAFVFEIEKVLIKLNLLDNRLFGFSGRAVNNFKRLISSIGSVLARIFEDVIAPALRPIVLKTLVILKTLGDTLYDGIVDNFSISSGERLARGFYSGLVSGVNYIKAAFGKITNVSIIDLILGNNPVAEIQNRLTRVFGSVLSFLVGFVSEASEITLEIFDEVGITKAFLKLRDRIERIASGIFEIIRNIKDYLLDAISSFEFNYKFDLDTTLIQDAIHFVIKLFESLYNYASSKLGKVSDIIGNFAEDVKDIFYNIYDEVVGNSFWPDTIDGVVDYTKNLFGAKTDLDTFKSFVLNTFEAMRDAVISFGEKTGGFFGDLVVTVAEIDVSKAKKLLMENIQGAVAAGLAIASGSLPAKIAGYGYFTALINDALGGALTDFTPKVLELIGRTAAEAGAQLAKGYLIGLDMILASIPSFVTGLTSAFLPFDGVLTAIFKFVPGFNNTLIQGLAVVGLALAAFQTKWQDVFTETVFGKFNKKGAKVQEGLVDYAKALLPDFMKTEGPGLLTRLFGDRKLVAAAAAAAFASINLQSITVFEGLGVGLPLLAMALLGKDGGSRLIADTLGTINQIFKTAAVTSFKFATSALGLSAFSDRLTQGITDSLQSSRSTKKVQVAFKRFLSEISQIPFNLNLNKDKYANREMSFADALFTLPNGKEVQIKKRFMTLMKAIGDQASGNGKLSDYWKDFADSAKQAGSSLSDVLTNLKGSSIFSGAWWSEKANSAKTFFSNAQTSAKKSKLSFAELATTLGGVFSGIKFGGVTLKLKSGLDNAKGSALGILDVILNIVSAIAGIKSASILGKAAKGLTPGVFKKSVNAVKGITTSTLAEMSAPKLLTDQAPFKKFRTAFRGIELATLNITKMFKALGTILYRLAAVALRFAAPFLKIGALAVGAGALALWLFGPGNSFSEKIQWAKDQIAGLFGNGPKSEVARTDQLLESIKGVNATDVQGNKIDLEKEIKRLNLSEEATPTKQFEVLASATEEFKTAVDQLDQDILKRGYETESDRFKRAELSAEYADTLRRTAIKPDQTLTDSTAALAASSKPFNDFLTVIGRLANGVGSFVAEIALNVPVLGGVLHFVSSIFNLLKGLDWSWLGNVISSVFEAIWTTVKYFIGGIAIAIAIAIAILTFPVSGTIGALAGFAAAMAAVGTAIYSVVDWAFPDLIKSIEGFFTNFADKTVKATNVIGKAVGLIKPQTEMDKVRSAMDENIGYQLQKASGGLDAERLAEGQSLLNTLAETNKQFQRDLERGWFESNEAYSQRVAAVEAKYAKDREAHYRRLNAIIAEGNKQLQVDKYQKYLDDASKNIKDQLGIDLGAKAIDFTGTDAQLEQMNKVATEAGKLRAEYAKAASEPIRRKIAVELAINKQTQQNVNNAINSMLTDAAKSAKAEELLGGAVGQGFVQFISNAQPAVATEMNKLAADIAAKQAELQTASLFDVPAIQSDIADLQKRLQDLLDPSKFRFEDINAGFQALGLEQMNSQLYLSLSRDEVSKLASGIRDAIVAQQNYTNAVSSGVSSWEEINNAMRNAIAKANILKGLQAETSARRLAEIRATPGLTPKGQLFIAQQEGLTAGVPANAFKSNAAATKTIGLLQRQTQATSELYTTTSKLNTLTGKVEYTSTLNVDAANRAAELSNEVTNIGEAIGKVGEASKGATRSFNDLISSLSQTGIEVSALGFSRLDEDARKALRSIGNELISINKRVEEAPVGASLSKLLNRQIDLLNSARERLFAVLSNTGESILNALSAAGVTETSIIGNLAENEIDGIIKLYARVLTAREKLKTASSISDFVKQFRTVVDAETDLNKRAKETNETYADRVSILNEMLGTSFSNLEFSMMDSEVVQDLVDRSRKLREEAESINSLGIASSTKRAASQVYSDIESLSRLGRLVEIFRQAGAALRDSVVEGAEAAYERIKKVFSNFDLTLREFTFLSNEDKTALSRQAAQLEMLKKLSAEQLPEAAAAIIESFDGSNLEEVTEKLKTTLGEDFLKPFQTPTEQLTNSLVRVKESVDNLTNAITGKPSVSAELPPIDNTQTSNEVNEIVVEAAKPEPVRTRLIEGSAVRRLIDAESKIFADIINKSLQGMTSREAAGVAINGQKYFDNQRLLNLANPRELERFNQIGVRVRKLYEALDDARRKGLDTSRIQAQIDSYTVELERIPNVIEANANRIAEAGKSMGETFNTSVGDALKGLMKGEMSFGSALSSIANNVTSKIIDNFVDSLIAPLTGEGSFLFGIFDKIGQTTAGGASQIGTAIAGQPQVPAAQLAAGVGGLFRTKKNPAVTAVAQAAAPVAEAASALPEAAASIAKPIGTVLPDAANQIASGCTELGTQVSDLAKAGGALGGAGGGLAGLAGLAGSLIGVLIGGLFADGGLIRGPGTGRSDSILAGVSNGEFIVNAEDTRKNLPLLKTINDGKLSNLVPKFAEGGLIDTAMVATPSPNTLAVIPTSKSKEAGTTVNLSITGDISRQTRSEIYQMLPSIAEGVNMHNREKGYR